MSYFFPRVLLFMVFFYIFESGSARGGDAITQRADRQFGTRQLRHSFRIDQVVFSPDRRLLASRDQRGNIKVWNTSTWNEVTDLNLASTTSDICFSPDGAYLVSTSALGVQRLNLKDASITTLSPGFPREHPRLAIYSPDSRLFAFADANKIEVFDFTLKRMKAHLDGHTGEFHSMSFFRDGSKLVSGGEDRTVRVWDLATGKLLHRLNSGEERVNKVAVDCFCKYIVSGGNDGVLRIWSASDGKELKQFKFANDISILALDFSRDGKLLAVGDSDGTVYLIDVEHFEVKNKLKGNPIAVTCLAFGGDRAFLAVAGDDNAIRMFNLDWTPEFPPVGHTDFVYSLDFSPDQKTFVSGGRDKLLCVWDCATEKEILRAKTPEEVYSACFSRDGKYVVTGERRGMIRTWNVTAGREVKSVIGDSREVLSMCLSPDGGCLASVGLDGGVKLWDFPSLNRMATLDHLQRGIKSVAFSHDGKKLAYCGIAGTGVRLWSVTGNKVLHEFQVDSRRISFAGNDWLLGSISDDRIFIFEVTSGRLVFEKKLSVGQIWALSWIPGTRNLGIATEKSGVMFLDCFSGDLVGDFDCKQTPIMSMAVNATGSRLLAGARDTTILMWQMSSLKTKKQIAATISFEECESIYGSLGTDAAGEAYRKMCRLLASPKVSGTVLRRSLKPTPSVDEVAVGKLILALSNDKFTVRDNAKKELLRLGDGINPYLLLRLKNPIEEDERAAIKSIQEHFEKCSGAQLRDLRALMVLEMIADSESIESIGAVAKGTAAARLTIEAQAALKRLSKEKVIGPK